MGTRCGCERYVAQWGRLVTLGQIVWEVRDRGEAGEHRECRSLSVDVCACRCGEATGALGPSFKRGLYFIDCVRAYARDVVCRTYSLVQEHSKSGEYADGVIMSVRQRGKRLLLRDATA